MDSLHPDAAHKLTRGLGLYDSTMIVAGSMIGSGIFIVAAEMSREVGSAGWMMVVWIVSGILTITAALSYGELAAMMPQAGGQYVYLREAFSPLWGFLYGWTLFLVIQTGTIAASSVGFSRYLGVLLPSISEDNYIIAPIHILPRYAVSLSTAQIVSLCLIAFLTWTNTRGLKYGKSVQNVFTTAKIGSLIGVILIGCLLGWRIAVVKANFGHTWTPVGVPPPSPGISPLGGLGIFIALCTAQIGSLFAADGWNNITFSAGEVRDPARNVPLSLALGTAIVMGLYALANFAYMVVLPFTQIQNAPSDRVAAAVMQVIFPGAGAVIIAVAIMIAAFGCMNGMILSGARAYFAMALDGLFFKRAARLNKAHVPASALVMQAMWVVVLVLVRTYRPATHNYGNLYSDLLDYVVSAALVFYILTIAGLFHLRRTQPNAERPYRAFGYPIVPALYMTAAAVILAVLFLYRPETTIPGVVIVLIGVPVYFAFSLRARREKWRAVELARGNLKPPMIKVGVEESIDLSLLGAFSGEIELVRIPLEGMEEIAVDFWIASLSPATSRRQWPHLKGVKVVQGLWAGVDSLRPLIPADVILCNARGVHDTPTAEWAVTAILAMQKYLPFNVGLQHRADWKGKAAAEEIYLLSEGAVHDPVSPVLSEEISGKTILIVGYGSIGKAIEARLAPFGAAFLRVARSLREGVAAVAALDDLLPRADVVVLITPLTDETRHLMNAARLMKMKRGALLVNAGRGAVVDTDALIKALGDGRIRAALDVTDPEPLPKGHPLWKAPNLLITPHIATDTPRFVARAFAFAAEQARRFASGEQLQNIISGEY